MSSLVCSISGSPLTEAVISLKTGHIFEKSTINKHIHAYGTCPHTHLPLALTDLVPLASNNRETVIVNSQFSDPEKIIAKMQAEYEALVLEAHFLKNSLRESRQELAISLYKQDASIRVISKLKSEIDENRIEIGRLMSLKK